MRDGFQLVARIPYFSGPQTRYVVASEVATMEYLRAHGIPVPKIYDYATTSKNAAGTEYIFMELIRGSKLSDMWPGLSVDARRKIVSKIVTLESQMFTLRFPASGSP